MSAARVNKAGATGANTPRAVARTSTMRAVVQDRYGDAGVLRLDTAPVPTPGPHEVLVRVHAASLNPADVFLMRGVPAVLKLSGGLRRPKQRIRGMDLAGTVHAVGAEVTRWSAGDAVFGEGAGTLGEFALAKESRLAPLPSGVPFEHGAAVPMAGTTAHMALEVARVQPGQRLLINGAAGGIGQFAVQLAHNAGVYVIGVCSTRNVERVRALGADEVLDYTVDDVLSPPVPYDVVLDNAGSVSIRDWRRVTARKGVIMPNSGAPGPDGGALRRVVKAMLQNLVASQRIPTFISTVTSERLERLAADLDSGAITPLIDTMYTLEHAGDAMERVASHHARGKVVVTVVAP